VSDLQEPRRKDAFRSRNTPDRGNERVYCTTTPPRIDHCQSVSSLRVTSAATNAQVGFTRLSSVRAEHAQAAVIVSYR